MKRLALLLLLATSAQAALTTIADTLKDAQGNNAVGFCVISWPGFTSVSGETIAAVRNRRYPATGNFNGAVNLQLEPTPTGVVYTVVCTIGGVQQLPEYWQVPTSSPVSVASIRIRTPPSPSIMVTRGQLPAAVAYEDEANIFTAHQTIADQLELRLREANANGANYIGIRAPASLGANFTLTLAALAAGFLRIDGSGSVAWTAASGVGACGANTWASTLNDNAAPSCTQPAFSNLSGIATPAQLSQTVNAQTGTTYIFVDGDRGKLVTQTNGSAIADTLPQAGAGSQFLSGWFVDVQNRGAGTVTITPTTSTIDGAASLALTTGQGVRLFSDGANYFSQRGVGGGGAHNLLSSTHSDTTPASVVRGDLLVGKNASPLWERLALGAAKKVPTSDGTDVVYRYVQIRSHATDCTSLTDGKEGEPCYEQDADTLYVCEPTAGDCDTAAEWRLVTGAAGGYTTVQDEGTPLTQRTTIDFAGSGINCVDSGGTKTLCTISGASSPLTTKGDLFTFTTGDARLAVGANGQALKANSSEASGLQWVDFEGNLHFEFGSFGGSAITTGKKTCAQVLRTCTATKWVIVGDPSGSAVVDLWEDTYANWPPTVADTKTGSEKPTLSSQDKNTDTSLTTWSTTFTKDNWVCWNVDSASTVTWIKVVVTCNRN